MDDDSDKPLDIDEDKFMKSMIKLLGIDDTILRPTNSTSTKSKQPSTTTTSSKKQSHTVPKTAPSGFNPSSLLLRPKPTSTAPLVTLDSSDDDTQDLSGSRGVGIVGNRRGVQESEDDSDDEKETVGKWDQAFIRGLESIQRELESRMLNDAALPNQGNDMDAGSDSEDTDDDDDVKLDEYMAQMDLELSRSKVGGSTKKKGIFGDAELGKEERPKWRLKRMEENGVSVDSDDGDDEEEEGEGDLDLDANLVKNLLESFQAQNGLPGPASNILGRLGVRLPREDA
ncbi:hypothetical protein HDU99_002683 [Rhizoclosmatium hyalinum]|nr:hypothetical protein HDU99_002683 [Rhizoclosmatium hyalinum]